MERAIEHHVAKAKEQDECLVEEAPSLKRTASEIELLRADTLILGEEVPETSNQESKSEAAVAQTPLPIPEPLELPEAEVPALAVPSVREEVPSLAPEDGSKPKLRDSHPENIRAFVQKHMTGSCTEPLPPKEPEPVPVPEDLERPKDILDGVKPISPSEQRAERPGRGRGRGKGRGRGNGKNENEDKVEEAVRVPKAKAKARSRSSKDKKPEEVKEVAGGEVRGEKAAEDAKPKAKAKSRSRKGKAAEEVEVEKVAEGEAPGEKAAEVAKPKATAKSRSRKSEEVAIEAEIESEKKRVRSDAKKAKVEVEASSSSSKRKSDASSGVRAKAKAKSSKEEPKELSEEEVAQKAAVERKARQSRKSSAYHQAKAVALKQGKSAEEANILGRKAPCHLMIENAWFRSGLRSGRLR